MRNYDVSFSESKMVLLNQKTNKPETFDLLENMTDDEAISATQKEIDASSSAARGAVSLLSRILDNPRLDAYKGQCNPTDRLPAEFANACRELEVEYLRPKFLARLQAKGQTDKTAHARWDTYIKGLRAGGSYANAASVVRSYLAICGKLPLLDNGKLLTVAAMSKLVAIAKAEATPKQDDGIAGKLVSLALDVDQRTEKTKLGDYATAIAALKGMLATYEGLYNENLLALTEAKGNVQESANAAIQAAADMGTSYVQGVTDPSIMAAVPSVESLTAMHDNGQMDDVTYQTAMLVHHNVEVQIVEEEALM